MILHAAFGSPITLVVVILGVWRLTSFICYDAGPFGLFSRARKILYQLRLGALVECFHCMSVWVAAAVVVTVYEPALSSLLLVVAVSGGTSLIERFLLK